MFNVKSDFCFGAQMLPCKLNSVPHEDDITVQSIFTTLVPFIG